MASIHQLQRDEIVRNSSRSADVFERTGQKVSKEVLVPVEQLLRLQVNGKLAAVLSRQPGDDIELAVGYCLSEGLVGDPREVLSARHCDMDSDTVDVSIAGSPPAEPRWVDTECINAQQILGELPAPLDAVPGVTWDSCQLLAMLPQFRDRQEQHKQSGGVHGAALFGHDGKLVVLREDIGRHNAVDKAVGYCVLHRLLTADMALMVSGRPSASMVIKAARANIPLLATTSNTTSLGWELADRLGLTLVTYLRGKSFRICTHPVRISG